MDRLASELGPVTLGESGTRDSHGVCLRRDGSIMGIVIDDEFMYSRIEPIDPIDWPIEHGEGIGEVIYTSVAIRYDTQVDVPYGVGV